MSKIKKKIEDLFDEAFNDKLNNKKKEDLFDEIFKQSEASKTESEKILWKYFTGDSGFKLRFSDVNKKMKKNVKLTDDEVKIILKGRKELTFSYEDYIIELGKNKVIINGKTYTDVKEIKEALYDIREIIIKNRDEFFKKYG